MLSLSGVLRRYESRALNKYVPDRVLSARKFRAPIESELWAIIVFTPLSVEFSSLAPKELCNVFFP